MAQPRVILLDEPTMGLAPVVVERLRQAFASRLTEDAAVLVAEENLGFVTAVAQRTYVLRAGRVAWSGSADQIEGDADVRRLLLG